MGRRKRREQLDQPAELLTTTESREQPTTIESRLQIEAIDPVAFADAMNRLEPAVAKAVALNTELHQRIVCRSDRTLAAFSCSCGECSPTLPAIEPWQVNMILRGDTLALTAVLGAYELARQHLDKLADAGRANRWGVGQSAKRPSAAPSKTPTNDDV